MSFRKDFLCKNELTNMKFTYFYSKKCGLQSEIRFKIFLRMAFYVRLRTLVKTKYINYTPEVGDEGLKTKNSDSKPKIRGCYRFIKIL